jgi:hypothetical protein
MIIYKGAKKGKIWKDECNPNNMDPRKKVYLAT